MDILVVSTWNQYFFHWFTDFTPLKYIPDRPAQVFVWHPDGRCTSRTIETKDWASYELYFDARTSQSGHIYWYRPEEGKERDGGLLYDILLYFLQFSKKQKGTKWKYIQKTLIWDDLW